MLIKVFIARISFKSQTRWDAKIIFFPYVWHFPPSRKKFFSSLYFLRAHTNKQFRNRRHNCNFTLQLHICYFERRNYRYYIFHFYFCFFSRAMRCGLKFSLKKRSSSHFTQHISLLTFFLTTVFLYLIEKSFLQRLTVAIRRSNFQTWIFLFR